ncbi:Asp23/Gls24 family envelope stress response protein [Enterococcus sp. LJL128]|uniref:Asp23/Gls24 family envelope stress response protein n=1 Tax=Enterococcus sp. LJL51 TaxID=3416656 RepID=UPI003CEB0ADC
MEAETRHQTSTSAFDETIIQTIIGAALDRIDGVLNIHGQVFLLDKENTITEGETAAEGIKTEIDENEVTIDLKIVVEFEKDLSKIFWEIKQLISEEFERLTNLKVTEVNVQIKDIVTKEEYQAAEKQ